MPAPPHRSVLWLFVAIAVSACGAPHSEPPPADSFAPSAARIDKPTAPVAVSLATRALGDGVYEVTLTARPTRDLPALELRVDGRREQLGPVRAGQSRALTVRATLAGAGGRDVVAAAVTGTGNHRRTRAAVARIGAPAPQQPPLPVRVITLSDGTELAEVRP